MSKVISGVCAPVCDGGCRDGWKRKEAKAAAAVWESGKDRRGEWHISRGKEKKRRGREGERLLCSFLEEEGIQSRGVMSTTASIYTSHLHGNMTHGSQHPETERDGDDFGLEGRQVHPYSQVFDWHPVSIAVVTQDQMAFRVILQYLQLNTW